MTMAETEPQYPEHVKLAKVSEKSEAAHEFFNWLLTEGYVLCKFKENSSDPVFGGDYRPEHPNMNKLLGKFVGIDPDKLEEEKRHMYKALQREAGIEPTLAHDEFILREQRGTQTSRLSSAHENKSNGPKEGA